MSLLYTLLSLCASLLPISILIAPFIITAIKKRRQLGLLWPVNTATKAKLKIAGKNLQCTHCGNTKFQKREGILVTSWVAFFRLSFWNLSATCYTCADCGHIEWFVRPKEEDIERDGEPSNS